VNIKKNFCMSCFLVSPHNSLVRIKFLFLNSQKTRGRFPFFRKMLWKFNLSKKINYITISAGFLFYHLYSRVISLRTIDLVFSLSYIIQEHVGNVFKKSLASTIKIGLGKNRSRISEKKKELINRMSQLFKCGWSIRSLSKISEQFLALLTQSLSRNSKKIH